MAPRCVGEAFEARVGARMNYPTILEALVGAQAAEIAIEYPSAPDLARADLEALHLTPTRRRTLRAALALGQLAQGPRPERPVVRGAQDTFALVADMRHARTESMRVLCLDSQHRVIRDVVVAHGGCCGVAILPREVFAPAVAHGAPAVILAHNHPSGDPTPSPEDILLTRQIVAAGQTLGIRVLDHVVVGEARCVSLQEMQPALFTELSK